jgi:predicted alpha/beta-hydrolase family hydrolase
VVCLAFPLRPPRHSSPAPSRLPELELVTVPALVVQGERDPFGIPPAGATREVVLVPGDHGLRATAPVEAAVAAWLDRLL